ncbi:hypothetical protein CG724_11710 [Streptomyces sp. CB02120-2]|nr:hypothetical protein CG724_11710 [Streptomyces sp. CB02120-2]
MVGAGLESRWSEVITLLPSPMRLQLLIPVDRRKEHGKTAGSGPGAPRPHTPSPRDPVVRYRE